MFDLKSLGSFYARIGSPTVDNFEKKMALLEGGTAAVATSSGQAAELITFLNLCQSGDHIISSAKIYGGTTNLLTVTLKKMGIEATLIDPDCSLEEIVKAARPTTKLIFAESLGNPALNVLDIEKFAKAAKQLGVPLVIDNTIASSYLCQPIKHGANIVIHSTTKYCDGHATSIGGVIVDGGNFDWTNGKFPEFTQPDESYHGTVYSRDFGNMAFAH